MTYPDRQWQIRAGWKGARQCLLNPGRDRQVAAGDPQIRVSLVESARGLANQGKCMAIRARVVKTQVMIAEFGANDCWGPPRP